MVFVIVGKRCFEGKLARNEADVIIRPVEASAPRGPRCARVAGGWALFGGLIATVPAAAQLGPSPQDNNLDIEHFAPQFSGFVTLDRTRSLRWGEWSVGLAANYSDSPLVLFRERLQVGEVVRRRLSADLVLTMGLRSWFELSAALPATLHQNGDRGLLSTEPASAGLRDIRVRPKVTLGTQDQTGFVGVAVVPAFTLPVGDARSFLSDGGWTFSPELLIDRTFSALWGLRLGAGGGVKLRPDAEIGSVRVTDEIFYRAGVAVGLPPVVGREIEGVAELFGVTRLARPFADRAQSPVIARVGGRATFVLRPGHELTAMGGVGVGGTRGYGAPDVHAWLGVGYAHVHTDRDGDGVADDDDACPDAPEDRDGFEDSDGCPDPDNDRDGIPDTTDRCPDDPEDLDGFRDQDGCPDRDDDRDGVPDVRDRCPQEKETINGIDDEDGCPDEGAPRVRISTERVTINDRVMFGFDSDRLKKESFSILDQVALTLQAHPELGRIRVEGHTDARGSDDYNLGLSRRRAASVVRYLVTRGVDSARLLPVGFGASRPVVDGDGKAAWAQNRRVEFLVLDPTPPSSEPPEPRRMTIPAPGGTPVDSVEEVEPVEKFEPPESRKMTIPSPDVRPGEEDVPSPPP